MKVFGNFSGGGYYPSISYTPHDFISIYNLPRRREKAIKARFKSGNISDDELRTMIYAGLLEECEIEDIGISEEKIEQVLLESSNATSESSDAADMESGIPSNLVEIKLPTDTTKKVNIKKGAMIVGVGLIALLFLKGN